MSVLKGYIEDSWDEKAQDLARKVLKSEKFEDTFFQYTNRYVGSNAIIYPQFIGFGVSGRVKLGLRCSTQDYKNLQKFVKSNYATFISCINLSMKAAGGGKLECTSAEIEDGGVYRYEGVMNLMIHYTIKQ